MFGSRRDWNVSSFVADSPVLVAGGVLLCTFVKAPSQLDD